MPQRTFPEHQRRVEHRVVGQVAWPDHGGAIMLVGHSEVPVMIDGPVEGREYDHRDIASRAIVNRDSALTFLDYLRSRFEWLDGPYLEQRAVITTAWLREDEQ